VSLTVPQGQPQPTQQVIDEGQPGPAINSIPNVAPRGGVLSTNLGESDAGIQPNTSEKLGAAFKQLSETSPVGIPFTDAEAPGSWVRHFAEKGIEQDLAASGQQKISPEEANRRYPGLPNPFIEAVYPEIADLRFSEAQRRKHLQDWIDRGPNTGFAERALGAAAGGITGLVAGGPIGGAVGVGLGAVGGLGTFSALDPANALAMVATGGLSKFLKIPANFYTSLGENMVANLATELPSYYQRRAELQDVSLKETLANAGAGAVLGVGLHAAIGAAAERFKLLPESVREKILRQGIAQHEEGQKVDLTGTVAAQAVRESGAIEPGSGQSSYVYRQLAHPSEAAHYRVYGAENDLPVALGPDFGVPGIHAVDNAVVANNIAAPTESQFEGKIQAVHVDPEAKVINLEEPLPKPLVAKAFEELKKAGMEESQISKDQLSSMTGKEVVTLLGSLEKPADAPSAMQALTEEAKSQGFDGYRYAQTQAGQPVDNRLFMFNEGKATPGETMTANSQVTPNTAIEERALREKQAQEPTSQADYSPDTEKLVQEQTARRPVTPEEIDPIIQAQRQQADATMKALVEEDPSIQDVIQENRRLDANDKQEAQALSDLINCASKDIV
jgi:hypothetical protein